jgi:hypothetical protein
LDRGNGGSCSLRGGRWGGRRRRLRGRGGRRVGRGGGRSCGGNLRRLRKCVEIVVLNERNACSPARAHAHEVSLFEHCRAYPLRCGIKGRDVLLHPLVHVLPAIDVVVHQPAFLCVPRCEAFDVVRELLRDRLGASGIARRLCDDFARMRCWHWPPQGGSSKWGMGVSGRGGAASF